MDKFENAYPGTYCKVSTTILKKMEYNNCIVSIYFEMLFHEKVYEPEELILKYSSDIETLKEIYFVAIKNNGFADYTGTFIKEFIKQDRDWLIRYAHYVYTNLDKPEDVYNRLVILWKDDEYLANFDYIFYNFSESDFLYKWQLNNAFRQLLSHDMNDEKIKVRQQEWVKHIIKDNYDNEYIIDIFSIIVDLSEELRREAFVLFISYNQDFDIFKQLQIEPDHWGGFGSMVPIMQKRILFLESLLQFLDGLTLLRHRILIQEKIALWRKAIEDEQVHEILRDMYM